MSLVVWLVVALVLLRWATRCRHPHPYRDRDASGTPVYRCPSCDRVVPIVDRPADERARVSALGTPRLPTATKVADAPRRAEVLPYRERRRG